MVDPADTASSPGADPADVVTLDESVSMALLVVLEALSPAERTAFLLHDVFGLGYDEIADVVGRPVAAVRQLASRARRRVHRGRPRGQATGGQATGGQAAGGQAAGGQAADAAQATRVQATRAQHRELLDAFTQASAEGDLERLVALLDHDVVWRADGGQVRAEPRMARGAREIAELIANYARRPPLRMLKAVVNGTPGLVIRDADGVLSVMALTADGDRITAIDVIRDPAKLGRAADLLDSSGI